VNLARLSVEKRVLAMMIVLVFVVLGAYSYTMMPVDLFPDIEFPFVMVQVVYPGAGPEEIESEVAEIIEEELISVAGVEGIETTCAEGVAIIGCEFDLDVDVDVAANDVRDKIAYLRSDLPEDIEEPVIRKFDPKDEPIVQIALVSGGPVGETFEYADEVVKPALTRIPGVATVGLIGGREREIQVDVSRSGLERHELSIMEVAGALKAENLNVPSGRITTSGVEYSVRALGKFVSVEEVADLRIDIGEGSVTRLSDIASVRVGYSEVRELSRVMGNSSIGISVRAQSGTNKVAVAADVAVAIERLRADLPGGMTIEYVDDTAEFIRDSRNEVIVDVGIGILLTAILLFMFVQSWKITLIAAISMPVTLVSALLLMMLAGFTINIMTLLALGIAIGVLVTNAIIVLENIARFKEEGRSAVDSAADGTNQVRMAVSAQTLTNVMVFTPMVFMGSIVGQFFVAFGLTVVFTAIFSLLITFTLTPMLAAYALERPERQVKFLAAWKRVFGSLMENLKGRYLRGLSFSIRRPVVVVICAFGLFISSMFLFGFLGIEFVDSGDQGLFTVKIELPSGSTLDESDSAMKIVEERLQRIPELEVVSVSVGRTAMGWSIGSQAHISEAIVKLVPAGERERSTDDVVNDLRPDLSSIPGAIVTIGDVSWGPGESDIEIEVTGPQQDTLLVLAEQLAEIVKENRNTASTDVDWRPGRPEYNFVPDRRRMAEFGVSLGQIAQAMRTAIEGEVATLFRFGGEEMDVLVRLGEDDRDAVEDIGRITLQRPGDNGGHVPLSDLGRIEKSTGPVEISRKDRQRRIKVSSALVSSTSGRVEGEIQSRINSEIAIPDGYDISFGRESEMIGETFTELGTAFALAIVLTYMLLAALMNSYTEPLIIMFTVPLGMIGIVLILFLTNVSLSMLSMMAMVMMVGIFVDNAILLIEQAKHEMKGGKTVVAALMEAGRLKFRAILMANLATIIAVLPLALAAGSGSATMRRPIAIVTIGGIFTSALMTLFVIPAFFVLFKRKLVRSQVEVSS
jgi:HAE1 family hydrophobic/amphiphilic exporter-1